MPKRKWDAAAPSRRTRRTRRRWQHGVIVEGEEEEEDEEEEASRGSYCWSLSLACGEKTGGRSNTDTNNTVKLDLEKARGHKWLEPFQGYNYEENRTLVPRVRGQRVSLFRSGSRVPTQYFIVPSN